MLKKLSLAALIAMGSMSVASATPLTEAIKNVNYGGYLRVRIYNDNPDGASATNRYRTTALFKFSVPVSEELKFNTAYAFDWSIYSDGTTWNDAVGGRAKNKKATAAPAPGNVKFFLQYSANGLTALVGKIPVPTPVTATGVGEATAAGGIVLYKVNDNVTVAAAGLDAMVGTDKVAVGGNNTYAAAVLYSGNGVKAQAWYFNVDNIIDSDIVLRADFKVQNIAVHADYATAELDDSISTKTQTYFNVSGKFAQDKMCAKIGFAATGKDGGTVALDGDAPISAVLPTPQKTNIINTTDDSVVYAKLGYKYNPKTSVYVAYADADKSFDSEIAVGGNYKYTKKMNIAAYYSILNANAGGTDNNEARVEFKYSF